MAKNYTDLVNTMAVVKGKGLSIDRVVLTDESMATFVSDGNFTESTEEKHEQLGEFSISIENGNDNYIMTETGERFKL